MLNLYKNIKNYRIDRDMSQEELAQKTGYKSRTSIAKIEKGLVDLPQSKIALFAEALNVEPGVLMGKDSNYNFKDVSGDVHMAFNSFPNKDHIHRAGVIINVLGRVAAGIPIEAIGDIIDTEEIPESMAATGNFFGLQIRGDSMEPRIKEGDVVIVRQQNDANSGDIVIATINGTDATCKRLRKYRDGIELISNNPSYEPMFFSNEEIVSKPVRILGRVVELRAKF